MGRTEKSSLKVAHRLLCRGEAVNGAEQLSTIVTGMPLIVISRSTRLKSERFHRIVRKQ